MGIIQSSKAYESISENPLLGREFLDPMCSDRQISVGVFGLPGIASETNLAFHLIFIGLQFG